MQTVSFAPLNPQFWVPILPSPALRGPPFLLCLRPSLPPSLSPHLRPTSEQRAASRVFLPYKFSSRGATRSTPISAIISDSYYLQIYRQEKNGCSRPGPKNNFGFIYLRSVCATFYALKQEILGESPQCSLVRLDLFRVTSFARCASLLRFGRLEDWTALSPDRPYLVR